MNEKHIPLQSVNFAPPRVRRLRRYARVVDSVLLAVAGVAWLAALFFIMHYPG